MSKTITGVPLMETGIEYPTSTGLVTLTEDDLASAVESQGDPAVVTPRLKLGHTDPRFNGPISEWDGEPAFGVAQNLHLENNGQTVVCDYVGVPDWLAEVLPSVYPNRSVEGNFDVETVTGHKWRFVISNVALLGVIWPGISTLDDLEAALSDEGPEGVEVEVAASAVSASTNLEDVRRSFYDNVATEESGRYWWWVRAILLDPNELIVDDDDGGLFRVPFTVNGETIAFEDPVPVKIEYVDAPVAASVLAGARAQATIYANSQDSRPAQREKEHAVTPSKLKANAEVDLSLLRRSLNLPEDATEEQINQALQSQAEHEPEPTPTPEPEPGDALPADDPAVPEPGGGEPSTQASGAVLVDRETLAQLQANAQRGADAYERQRVGERDGFLNAAVQAGKFPPARLAHWAAAWEKDPEGIKTQIESMPAGLIPVHQLGGAPNEELAASGPMYPPEWLPEVHRQPSSTITQEA